MTSQIDPNKILVVDDSLTVRMEIKEIFEANGYRVLLAPNGRQCFELLETERPDIILLDVKMPEMDGYEVCRRLKSNAYCQTVPVIFISASGETARKVEGFKAGGVDFIAKPFEREEVLARVGTHLHLRELSEQLERKVDQRTAELTLANQQLRQQIAERRKVEENLLLMNFALNHIRESAFLIDKNAHFHFVNEESCRILGYTREELLDMGVADVDPDWPIERWHEHWEELKTQGSLTFEGRHRAKDNRIFPVEINANYIEYAGQAYNLALVRDITERKQAEEALIASERRMSRCLANIPGFAYTFRGTQDGHFNLPYASPGIETLYGLKPEDVLEDMTPLHQLAHPEDRPRIEAKIAESAKTMKPFLDEFRVCRPNRPDCWIAASSIPDRDEDGSILWHGIMLDINERIQVETEIHRLVGLQSAILSNAAYMVIAGSVDGIITLFNPAAEQALGYTAEECVGHLTPTIFHDPDEITERARIFSKELGMAIEPGFEVFVAKARHNLPNEYEWTYIHKDGRRFPVLLSVTALRDSQGNINGFLGMATDITERKQAEAEIRQLNQELEQRVADRTSELVAA
ncbi:MAG: PAS domain S-box protein, partial [Desulfobacteraceae bacterium]